MLDREPGSCGAPSATHSQPWSWRQAGLALGGVFLYAASDELHQHLIPGRTGQVSAVGVDG